ncbi:MAG: glycogen/starch/alpha-glucan phosphorylase [Sulfolobales archaeon]
MAILSITMEIALEEVPIYAGGLGVLEGDKFYAMARKGLEYYVITLFHRNGYVEYEYRDGSFIEKDQEPVISQIEGKLKKEKELAVTTKLYGEIRVEPLVYEMGKAKAIYLKPVYPDNIAYIARRLYIEDSPEQAITKYIVLARSSAQYIRERIGVDKIEYIDLQESNASLAALALKEIRDRVRLVIHTPGPWGHPMIPGEIVGKEFEVDVGSGLKRLTDIVLDHVERGYAVSRKHLETLSRIFPQHYWKLSYVRNGVDLDRWSHKEIKSLASKGLRNIGLYEFKRARDSAREDLISLLRSKKPGVRVGRAIVAWARRITRYKRPYLVERLIGELGRELDVTFVLAGKAHPRDGDGREMMMRFRKLHEEMDNVVYIYDYGLEEARTILSGADLLLFTPFPGWEACGTSYMKAGINGVPTLSSRDGGVLETIIDRYNGWLFGLEVTQFINIYEDTASVSKIDEEDYRDLRKKLIEILSIIEKDLDIYLEISLNALKSFRISSDIYRALEEYGYIRGARAS